MTSNGTGATYDIPGTIVSSNVVALGTVGHAPPLAKPIDWISGGKHRGETIERNIVHGSEAWVLSGKKDRSGPPSAADGDETWLYGRTLSKTIPNTSDTHRWRVYLRALNPKDDLTHFIKEVMFELHESFPTPKITLCAPPYEVEATGWGEFTIIITVFFHDPSEKPVEFHHLLKLFGPDNSLPKKGRSIISEHHDQVIFVDPSEPLYQALIANPPSAPPANVMNDDGGAFHDEDSLNKVISASDRVKDEIARLRTFYEAQVKEANELRRAIDALQAEEQARHIAAKKAL
jgi:YEATS domain-containing protein 4